MKKPFAMLAAGLAVASAGVGQLRAEDLSKQDPVALAVHLGDKGGKLVFEPSALKFETGKLYKLVLDNPSPSKHYFSATGFASAIWTRKVEAGNAEIKGTIREIELKPGGKVEWYFVPVQAGTFELKCTIPGHAEAGMVGEVRVE